MVMGAVLLYIAPRTYWRVVRGKKRVMSLTYLNPHTGAEVHLGRTGAGFYVEARHPDFPLPFRKTYEWFQEGLAIRDYDILRAVVGTASDEAEEAVSNRK
jgi:hypothetical protein